MTPLEAAQVAFDHYAQAQALVRLQGAPQLDLFGEPEHVARARFWWATWIACEYELERQGGLRHA